MKKNNSVSISVIKRLPKYFRYLNTIADKGIVRVSSKELSEITGLTASQIRQDLNHYGCFGQQGYGYNVRELIDELANILGINRQYSVILVGFGNLGRALYNYQGFRNSGYSFKAIFDRKPEIIEGIEKDVEVFPADHLKEYLKRHKIDIAILAIPKENAQDVCDTLCEGNIKGIWNFVPDDLKTKNNVVLENVHLDESLFTLTYFMNNPNDFNFRD
ncbi:MAG: redox-sensing transcriptional repressor Rex [Tissierellia bacterium]|nr:redox-sensing transcriptional repressor Rex [Tissierellia bacterium]